MTYEMYDPDKDEKLQEILRRHRKIRRNAVVGAVLRCFTVFVICALALLVWLMMTLLLSPQEW